MGVGGVVAYNTFFKKTKASIPSKGVKDTKYEAIKRDTIYDFSSGKMKITRNRVEDKSMELDDSWTVLMYVCGSDLESEKGVDSKTLDSLKGSNINAENISNLNLIVQTGGTDKWKSNYGTPDKLTRLKLNASGTLEEIEKIDNKSMGDPQTLADFMKWGYTKYPAKNTMLILVDHGGPENNMCYDTSTGKVDELTIQELEYAFAKTKESLQAPIDTVITHTCGNGTVELASALVPYADYLITAPTYTASYGFNYKRMINSFLEQDKSPATVCDDFLSGYKINSIIRLYSEYAVALYDLTKLDDFLVEFNDVSKKTFELAAKDVKTIKKINKVATNSRVYQYKTNMDIGLYLDGLNKKVGIDTTRCRELLEQTIVRKVRGIFVPKNIAGMAMFHLSDYVSIQHLNNLRNKCVSPYYMMYLERTWQLMGDRKLDNYKDYDWVTSKYFYEDNFNFLNYTVANYSNPLNLLQMQHILETNPDYVSDGFYNAWRDNIGERSEEQRKKYKVYEINAEEGTYNGKITENPDEVNTVYNTVYAKLGEDTICLGENADAVYNEESGEFKSNFKGEWLILSDGQLLTTYYTGKLKDYDNGGNEEGDVYAIPVQIGDKESTIYITKGDTEVKVEYVTYDAYGQVMSGFREELTAGMKFTPIYDVWNEEENTYDTEYGEEYTYNGKDDFLYTILSEDEYSYAFIVEDASGHKMVSEMQEFSVKGQEITLKTEDKENKQ
jgi:hypothetical protein